MKKIKLSSWILFFLFLLSCSEKEAFSEFHSFQSGIWNREEPAVFEINVSDTLSLYNLDIIIRNNDDYPFQNIWLFIDRKHPGGAMTSDSLNIEMSDVYGKWYGRGLSLYSLTIPYKHNLRYPSSGNYTYIVRHGMRKNPILGISDIGLTLSKNSAQ